ncbi:hypothetical protein BDV96DRAFT_602076 [Lophiotrema nucula]|uniref:Uncharacterized protein n=1 Tax=Lophiotrema nucula TaxID=690887 RepID=A0A6A5YZX3_9PLEO|nr:hypothetical protein BDV96DRAFT_602076 [Lophiotrema nucula]
MNATPNLPAIDITTLLTRLRSLTLDPSSRPYPTTNPTLSSKTAFQNPSDGCWNLNAGRTWVPTPPGYIALENEKEKEGAGYGEDDNEDFEDGLGTEMELKQQLRSQVSPDKRDSASFATTPSGRRDTAVEEDGTPKLSPGETVSPFTGSPKIKVIDKGEDGGNVTEVEGKIPRARRGSAKLEGQPLFRDVMYR